jgi:hypothetical protein
MPMKAIGGLWIGETKHGDEYLSGIIEIEGKKVKIALFLNKNKRNKRDPDWSVWKIVKPKGIPRPARHGEEIEYHYG